jgi:hypothetical protein
MKKKLFITAVFLLPVLIILSLAVSHRMKSSGIGVETGAIPEKLLQTQATWNNHDFSPISTGSNFMDKLGDIPINGIGMSPTDSQKNSIHEAIKNLVLANYLGDYDAYRKFLSPKKDYYVDNETVSGMSNYFVRLFPSKSVPMSFEEIDRQIWNHDFGNHPYWRAISINDIKVECFQTNQIPFMELSQLYPNAPYAIGSYRASYLSFDKLLGDLLLRNGKIAIAKITLMVESADLPNDPRPFIYVLAEDADDNLWIPVEMGWFSSKMVRYQPRF